MSVVLKSTLKTVPIVLITLYYNLDRDLTGNKVSMLLTYALSRNVIGQLTLRDVAEVVSDMMFYCNAF